MYYAGIDAHRSYLTVAIVDRSGEVVHEAKRVPIGDGEALEDVLRAAAEVAAHHEPAGERTEDRPQQGRASVPASDEMLPLTVQLHREGEGFAALPYGRRAAEFGGIVGLGADVDAALSDFHEQAEAIAGREVFMIEVFRVSL